MINIQIWPLIKIYCSDETYITCHYVMLGTTYAKNSNKFYTKQKSMRAKEILGGT